MSLAKISSIFSLVAKESAKSRFVVKSAFLIKALKALNVNDLFKASEPKTFCSLSRAKISCKSSSKSARLAKVQRGSNSLYLANFIITSLFFVPNAMAISCGKLNTANFPTSPLLSLGNFCSFSLNASLIFAISVGE